MRRFLISSALLAGLAGGAAAVAAAPRLLPGVEPGLWEVSRTAAGENPSRQCLADLGALAQWQHRGAACTRVILSQTGTEAVVHYTCPGGDFGRSKLTVLTPRSLKLETQGIHRGEPFGYNLYARRSGNC